MKKQNLNVLMVNASGRQTDSVTRRFAKEMLDEFHNQYTQVNVQDRDVATAGLPFIDEQWINANFTPEGDRSDEDKASLTDSNALVKELQQSDVILIAAPIYNFTIPASLKAWFDLIARVGLTFEYTANGPVGMLHDKKAYLVLASGGTQIGSDIDFASSYLRHILSFIGIDDVSIISAECFDQDDVQATQNIRTQISELAQRAA